ncbi:MAG: dienelactone hydrolase family protein [Clostridia bacterium]|nr:dienelactone hydrolase family protein [Clostridia bacterium]
MKRFLCLALSLLMMIPLMATLSLTASAAFDATTIFTAQEYKYSDDLTLPYRLYVPADYDASKQYPLVLFLHGYGERGTDNAAQLNIGINYAFQDTNNPVYDCIVVAPQCPATDDETKWTRYNTTNKAVSIDNTTETDAMLAVLDVLELIQEKYNVDSDRIYSTGLSMGAFGTWELISRHTDMFAAAVTVCGGGDPTYASKLADFPIWNFHGTADASVPYSCSVEMCDALKSVGNDKLKFTTYYGKPHSIWNQTYSQIEVWEWLLSHKKSDREVEKTVEQITEYTKEQSGQIWEGETDIRYGTNFTLTGTDKRFYPQNLDSYNFWTIETARPSQNAHAIWTAKAVGDTMTIPLDVEVSGEKEFYIQFLCSQDFGIFDIYWDDELIGDDIDTYAAYVKNVTNERHLVEFNLGKRNVTKGEHTLKIVAVGQNTDSVGYAMGLDFFELVGEDGVRRVVNINNTDANELGYITRFEDGTIRYEAERMELSVGTQADITAGTTVVEYTTGAWTTCTKYPVSFAKHLYWTKGSEISLIFYVEESGEYQLNFHGMIYPNYGIMKVQLDGAEILTVDQYSASDSVDISMMFAPEKTYNLSKGYHTLTLVQNGKNASATNTNTYQSLDYMEIKKVGEYKVTGQIWEGETDLRAAHYLNNKHNFYYQDVSSVNTTTDARWLTTNKPSNDGHAIWNGFMEDGATETRALKVGDELVMTLDVKTSGIKTFYLRYLCSGDFGIFDIYWDGDKIGQVDMYAGYTAESPRQFKDTALCTREVTQGTHTLTLKVVGKNENATKYNGSIDFFELVGTDGLRHERSIDYRGSNYNVISYSDNGTIRYEAENMALDYATQAKIDAGTYGIAPQTYNKVYSTVSGYNLIRWPYNAANIGEKFSFVFNVDEAGYYSVGAGNVTANRFGMVQYMVDDQIISEVIDQYTTDVGSQHHRPLTTTPIFLSEGKHTFSMVLKGKNDAVTNPNYVSLDYIELTKVDDLDTAITGRSLTLADDLTITYAATVPEETIGDNRVAMKFEMNNRRGEATSITVAPWSQNANAGKYTFRFEHIAPQMMGENIKVSLVLVDELGAVVKTLDTVESDSVKNYLMSLLSTADPTEDAALITLISDLLTYGQAAVDYTGDPVAKVLDGTETGLTVSTTAVAESTKTLTTADGYTGGTKFTAASVRFDNINKLLFKYTADATKTVTVKVDGVEVTPVSLGSDNYAVYTDGIYAIAHDTAVKVELLEDGVVVQTLEYSVNNYAYAMQSSTNESMKALATALYRYGASAVAYAG